MLIFCDLIQVLRPVIDSKINHIRHFIKIVSWPTLFPLMFGVQYIN